MQMVLRKSLAYNRAMGTFFSELRRRNVLRVAATYALVAWIVIEAGSVLLPTFGASDTVFRYYVIAVIIGFFIALALSWIYELTPDGVKRDSGTARADGEHQRSRQRLNVTLIVLLLVALTVSVTFNVTGIRDNHDAGREAVAVLPFASENPEQSSFADAMHREVLFQLANNRALRVIANDSVREYRNTDKSLAEIGDELGVDTIVRGHVRRANDDVQVTVEIIDPQDGNYLWSERYSERVITVEDLFGIQSNIAASIARELSAEYSPEQEVALQKIPTNSIVAYSRYSDAHRELAKRRLREVQQALELFSEAIALDPNFAEAHAGHAMATILLYINFKANEKSTAFRETQASIDAALALNPELADAHAALGLLNMTMWQENTASNNNLEAATAFEKAIELNKNHASAYMWYASLLEAENDLEQAIVFYNKSLEIDPLGRVPRSNLPLLYAQRGENERALNMLVEATELHRDWPTVYRYVALHLNAVGRLDEALAWTRYAEEITATPLDVGNLMVGIYVVFGELDRAQDEMRTLPDEHPLNDLVDGITKLIDADVDGAYDSIMSAVEARPERPSFVYELVANVALIAQDLAAARKYTLLAKPVLASDTDLVIDKNTVKSVVMLAYIEKQGGNQRAAIDMLRQALPFIQSRPRLGIDGLGILDVQAYAILGQTDDAISALRVAVDSGFRSSLTYDFWLMADDPYLAQVRQHPDYTEIWQVAQQDIERMHRNVIEAEEKDDWESLRRIAVDNLALTTASAELR